MATIRPRPRRRRWFTIMVESGVAIIELDDAPRQYVHLRDDASLDGAILKARFADDVHVVVLRGHRRQSSSRRREHRHAQQCDPRFKFFFCLHATRPSTVWSRRRSSPSPR